MSNTNGNDQGASTMSTNESGYAGHSNHTRGSDPDVVVDRRGRQYRYDETTGEWVEFGYDSTLDTSKGA